MCGRYLLEDEAYADILQILHNLKNASSTDSTVNANVTADVEFSHGEIFPTNIAPVSTSDGIVAVKWGFPHWKNTSVIINARAETAAEKKMFSKPLRERRCIVPSSGFFEWEHTGSKKKKKYQLNRPDSKTLYMAGIVSTFRDALGEQYNAFVILTTAANEYVAPLHDRMPVILAADEREQWLKDESFVTFALHRPGPELITELVG